MSVATDAGVFAAGDSRYTTYGNVKAIRFLVWIYFFLLIFEGAIRMLLPAASNALLVIRDPFLIVAYIIAQMSGVFPWNRFVLMFWLLGLMATVISFVQMPYAPLVILYGFRVGFLHVPLIFLIPKVMDARDVVTFGRWFLILAIPIAVLMAVQFRAGPNSWLNRGLEMQFKQIDAGFGKIRPPGTFTFIMGPALFYGYVIGFVMFDQFHKGHYTKLLVTLAACSTCLALSVSGSRSALSYVGLVILAAATAVLLAKPKAAGGLVRFGFVAAIALFGASQLPVFDEGADTLSHRIQTSESASGFVNRFFGDFARGIEAVPRAQLTGEGLGTGTNGGVALMRSSALHVEDEWSRVVLEMGPTVALIYILMRVGLLVWLLLESLKAAKRGTMLPMLMLGACGLGIVTGQWGQPTELGFMALGGGLCLAAMKNPEERSEGGEE